MKKNLLWALSIMLLLPGCWGSKKDKARKGKKKTEIHANVDIPLAPEEVKSYFDDDISGFTLLEDDEKESTEVEVSQAQANDAIEAVADQDVELTDDDFFWIEDEIDKEDSFKAVYFEFDKDDAKDDQAEYINHNIAVAKNLIENEETPIIVVEGNSCSSAGSRSYNIAKSNSRAQAVATQFIEAGIPAENIKIVGRGTDSPALDIDGNPVSGDKDQQWPNRRVDIKIYS